MQKLKCQINDKAQMSNQIQMTKWQIRAIWKVENGTTEDTEKGFLNEKWKVENGKGFYLYLIDCE